MTTQSCTYCGASQSWSGNFVDYIGKDPSTLNTEINKLEAQIKRLNEQRSRLLRQLNVLQSPLGILPPETISLIFQFTCPQIDFDTRILCKPLGETIYSLRDRRHTRSLDSPISLGSVSSYWRQIVHSTPTLWNSIILTVFPHHIPEKDALLRLYLKNSGILPFSLELDFRWSDRIINTASDVYQSNWRGTGPPLEPIRQLVMEEFPERMSILWINCPPSEWLVNVPNTFTQLRRLGVGWLNTVSYFNYIPRGDLSLSNVPNVKELKLTRVGPSVELCWINMTVIDLSYVHTDICVELLLRCPNLVEFRSRYAAEPDPHRALESLQFPNTITLAHLRTFEWESRYDHWNTLMLQRLHIPTVQNLIWSVEYNQGFHDDFKDFFRRVSALKVLELRDGGSMREDMVEDILWNLNNVHTLVLQMCDNQFIERMLYAIGPERKNIGPFLPNLKSLQLRGTEYHHISFGDIDGPMFKGLLALLPVRKEFFPTMPLHLDIFPVIKWSEEAKEVLRDLRASEGYNFEIFHDSEPVDWLDEEDEDDIDWLKESGDEIERDD